MGLPTAPATALADGEYGVFEGTCEDAIVFGTYRREGTWARALVELLSGQLLGSGGTLLDVGANIGLCTVPTLARSAARALAFEPEPLCHRLLVANVARHGLSERAECFEVALSDRDGRGRLAVDPHNRGDNRLVPQPRHGDVEVRLARLDGLLAERDLAPPVVMKLDAQGAEAAILRGAPRTLDRVDHVVLEYWPFGLALQGDRPEALRTLLAGFASGAVLDQRGTSPERMPAADVFDRLAWIPTDGSDQGFFDLLLSR